jgi:hypothetical protein
MAVKQFTQLSITDGVKFTRFNKFASIDIEYLVVAGGGAGGGGGTNTYGGGGAGAGGYRSSVIGESSGANSNDRK